MATIRPADVLGALRAVQDPDAKADVVSLGNARDIAIDSATGKVSLTLRLATANAAERARIKAQAERAVMALDGVAAVHVDLGVAAAAAGTGNPAGDRRPIPGVRQVIAVSSGKGGVGKSTVCVNLAAAMSRLGARVGILDGDIYGPNIPLMLGVTGRPEGNDQRIFPFVAHGMQVISMALLVPEDQPMIWRGPMLNKAVQQFMFQVDWHDLDYLFVDLPPGTGDVQLTLTQNTQITGAVIVTTPQEVAVLDVKKAVRMFEKVGAPCLGVVENMTYFQPPGSEERFELFGRGGGQRISSEFSIPLLGQIPMAIPLREGGDTGKPLTLTDPESEVARAFTASAESLRAILQQHEA